MMEKKYEVELINENDKGEITYSNFWDDNSAFFDTYEEALKEAKEESQDWYNRDFDTVLVNEVIYNDDGGVEDSSCLDSFKIEK